MSLDPKRTVAELKELRALTGDENGAQRVAWTDTWLKARAWFASKLKGLPVEHHMDAAGNSWVTLPGASAKSLLIGGHLDSVPNGGWLDGSLNELAGLEVLRRINSEFAGRPPVTVRLVDWADEEGARFGRSLLGSAAAAGSLKIEDVRELKDRQGTRLVDGGKVALLGIPPARMAIDWNQVIFKGLEIKGVYGREMFETWYKMVAMLQSGLDLSPIITHHYAAEEFEAAFATMLSGQSGKIILDWAA